MMRDEPLISVVMPVFNAERFLADAVNSILEQTESNFEFIIIDDGSTDGTKAVLEGFVDSRIKLISLERNHGLSFCLNLGLDHSRGSLLARMDADDVCVKNRFEEQVQFLTNNPDVAVVGSWAEKIDSNGGRIGFLRPPIAPELICWRHLFGGVMIHPSVMMRRHTLSKWRIRYGTMPIWARDDYRGFKLRGDSEDHLFFGLLMQKVKFANLSLCLLKYRIHGSSVSATRRSAQHANGSTILCISANEFGVRIPSQEVAGQIFRTSGRSVDKDTQESLSCLNQLYERFFLVLNYFPCRMVERDYRLRRAILAVNSESSFRSFKALLNLILVIPSDKEELRLSLELCIAVWLKFRKNLSR